MFYFDVPTGNFYAEGTQPQGAYELSREEHAALYDALARGNMIVIVDGRPQAVDLEPTRVTAPELKAIVTRYRWEVETGGITLPSGIKVATALDDQNRITTVVANARLAGLEQVKFKAASGWVTLAVADVEGIAAAIALHVQACFTAECAHHDAIDAIELIADPTERQAALDDYDEATGWPSTQQQPAAAL